MRHRKSGRKFGMDGTARKAMLRNMVTSLLLHGQIQTTVARAKELRRYAEKVITSAKRAPSAAAIGSLEGEDARSAAARRVHAIRRIRRWVNNDDAMARLFDEYAPRFEERAGGYTRVVKTGIRPGDNAEMAIIEVVGESARVEDVDFTDDAEDVGGSESAADSAADADAEASQA